MVDIALNVIPEPEEGTATVLIFDKLEPVFKGEGSVNFICGGCGFRVAENLQQASQIQNIVVVCPRCKSHLETRL